MNSVCKIFTLSDRSVTSKTTSSLNKVFLAILFCCIFTTIAHANANSVKKLPKTPSASCSKQVKVDAFFDTGTLAKNIKLDPESVFPHGVKFPFSFYSTGGGSEKKRGELLPEAVRIKDQDKVIRGGATLLGPQYELNDGVVALAKKYNVKAIYSLIPKVNGKHVNVTVFYQDESKLAAISEEMLKGIVEDVKANCKNPEIAWWYIQPEELKYWRKYEIEYLKKATAAIRANDPMKRPIMFYDPGHRTAPGLKETCQYLDFVAKGSYTNYSSQKNSRAWVRFQVEDSINVRKLTGNKDLTVLSLPGMFLQPKKEELPMIDKWVRHDVYCALVAGAQGIVVFSGSKRAKFSAHEQYLNAYLKAASELTQGNELGKVFLFGERKNDLRLDQLSGPKTQRVKSPSQEIDKVYPTISMANFAFNRMRFVFLVNSANEPVSGIISGLPYSSKLRVDNTFAPGEPYGAPEGEFKFRLPALGVAGYVIYRETDD